MQWSTTADFTLVDTQHLLLTLFDIDLQQCYIIKSSKIENHEMNTVEIIVWNEYSNCNYRNQFSLFMWAVIYEHRVTAFIDDGFLTQIKQ